VTSERVQLQIERLLDEAETAMFSGDWATVLTLAQAVLRIEPENGAAATYLLAATRDDAVEFPPPGKSPTVRRRFGADER